MASQVEKSMFDISESAEIFKADTDARYDSPPIDLRAFRAQEHLSHGLALHIQGKFREALDEYRRGLEFSSNDAYGRYLTGLALKAIGRDQEAFGEWALAKTLRAQDEDCAWGVAMAKKLLDSNF